jgi:hypothetical protein
MALLFVFLLELLLGASGEHAIHKREFSTMIAQPSFAEAAIWLAIGVPSGAGSKINKLRFDFAVP